MQIIDANQPGTHEVRVGVPFTLELNEIPTSGYLWNFEPSSEAVQILTNHYQLHTDSAVGGGGKRTFVVQINQPGTHSAVLRLFQPWSGPSSSVQQQTLVFNTQT
jgi:predicted secreted protein